MKPIQNDEQIRSGEPAGGRQGRDPRHPGVEIPGEVLRRGRVVFDGPSPEIAGEQFEALYEIEGAGGGRDDFG